MDWIITVAGGGSMGTHFFASSFHALNRVSGRYASIKSRCPEPDLPAQIQTFCS